VATFQTAGPLSGDVPVAPAVANHDPIFEQNFTNMPNKVDIPTQEAFTFYQLPGKPTTSIGNVTVQGVGALLGTWKFVPR